MVTLVSKTGSQRGKNMHMLFLGAVSLGSLVGKIAALHVPASQGSHGATRARATPPPPSAMHLRGGHMDIGINPKHVAKVAIGFTSVWGGILMLQPDSEVRELGSAIMGFAVLGYMSLAGKPFNEAIAWAHVPSMLHYWMHNGDGFPTLVSAVTFWALLNNSSFSANFLVKLVISYNLFSGAFFYEGFVFETPAIGMFMNLGDINERVLFMSLSDINLRFGIMALALHQGASAAKAVGYAFLISPSSSSPRP